jgi:hypothetical protein
MPFERSPRSFLHNVDSIYLFEIHQSGEGGNHASEGAFEKLYHKWTYKTWSLEKTNFPSQK